MKKYLKKTFGLSDSGAKDLFKACVWSTIVNICLMSTSGFLYSFLNDSLDASLNGLRPSFNLAFYIGYVVVIFIFIFISYYFTYNFSYMSAYEASAEKRITIAETLRKLPLSFFGKKDLSDVTSTIMADCAELENTFSHFIPVLIGSISSTILVSIGLFVFNFKMALATLWVVPVSFAVCVLTKAYQEKFSKKAMKNRLDYDSKLTECIENIKDIKANNRKLAHQSQLDIKLEASEKHQMISELGIGLPIAFAQMILKVGIATSMIMGINLLSKSEINLMTFLMFMVVVTRIFDPVAGALINLAGTFNSLISIERMKKLESTEIQLGKEEFNPNGYDISFKNVVFAYNDDENVINDVSFTAKQGQITALVGPSGGGKSTALKLCARFWDVTSGSVKIGGEDISNIEPETLLQSISIVFQDVTLFDNTVLENVRIGKKGASDDEVMNALKEANCMEFVEKLSNGVHTFIGENGASLSGGERQRLSIARALLKDAPIVLLDEATSSLDIKSESAVQSAINRLTKGKTVIVIAHRMRTIAGADNIILLKDGKVAEEGTHSELMKLGENYANMVSLQVKSLNFKLV